MATFFTRLMCLSVFTIFTNTAFAIPSDFVYLHDVAPTIQQNIRYASYHNFIGRPIKGYEAAECVLTKEAANALVKVQTELERSDLSLKVYDCYRPQMAVDDFVAWSRISADKKMKAENYPNINKDQLFPLGYIAEKSGHTRGSTIDLTIVAKPTLQQAKYHRGDKLTACFANYQTRFRDNSIDMGTGFDCMDELSHPSNQAINTVAYHNRQLLADLMVKNGFKPLPEEWWHFTLINEPYPNTYFNFPIQARND